MQQEATRAQAAAEAAQVDTKRARADAERTLAQVRAANARERDELRADLRARAERAEHQADAYRAELDRLRPAPPTPSPPSRPSRQPGGVRAARQPSPGRRPTSEPLRDRGLEYWRAYLPGSYGRLEDPEEFFTELGEQADAEIEDRYLEYAGPDIPGESVPPQPKPSSAPRPPKLTGRKG